LPIFGDEARKHDVSRPLSFCKAREQRPRGTIGIKGGRLSGQTRGQTSPHYETENEGVYRIISKTLMQLLYFLPEKGKKCPVEKRRENNQVSVNFG
jgi:hypothetical protein